MQYKTSKPPIDKAIFGLALLLFFISTGCNPAKSDLNGKPDSLTRSAKEKKQEESPTTDKALPSTKWSYSETEDKMSEKINTASVAAKDELEFDFPYDGGATATLTIRKKDGAVDMYLHVSKGQFNSTFDGGTVRIKFDNEPPKSYSFSGASDHSSDIIFLNSSKEIVKKLKSSKSLIIEAEFFNEGKRQMEFNVEGLRWE